MASDAARNEILARFPGPVTLYPSRRKWLPLLAVCLLFVAGSWDSAATTGDWVGWFGVAFFGLGAIVSVVMMSHSAVALTLDPAGFTVLNLFRRDRWEWQDASGFEVETLPFARGRKFVAFDNAKMKNATLTRIGHSMFLKHNAMLGDSYGLAVADLAQLITQWRERALAAVATTRAKPRKS